MTKMIRRTRHNVSWHARYPYCCLSPPCKAEFSPSSWQHNGPKQARLYVPDAQFYLILSQDPDRYQLFDNICSRVVRPPAKKGAMKLILLLSLSVRCPLWLDSVTVQKLSRLRYYTDIASVSCISYCTAADFTDTRLSLWQTQQSWRTLIINKTYRQKNKSQSFVIFTGKRTLKTSRYIMCVQLCATKKKPQSCLPQKVSF